MSIGESFSERVCLVLLDEHTDEDVVRERLRSPLPIRFERWSAHTYVDAIRSLRPRIIVVTGNDLDTAHESVLLLSALLDPASATMATLVIGSSDASEDVVTVWFLGREASVRVGSLEDLALRDL